MKNLAFLLSGSLDRNLIDSLTAYCPIGRAPSALPATPSLCRTAPTFFTALREQHGLRLESGKGPVDSLVIEHVGKPSANRSGWNFLRFQESNPQRSEFR